MEVGELALNARIVAKLIANRLSSPVQFGRLAQRKANRMASRQNSQKPNSLIRNSR